MSGFDFQNNIQILYTLDKKGIIFSLWHINPDSLKFQHCLSLWDVNYFSSGLSMGATLDYLEANISLNTQLGPFTKKFCNLSQEMLSPLSEGHFVPSWSSLWWIVLILLTLYEKNMFWKNTIRPKTRACTTKVNT